MKKRFILLKKSGMKPGFFLTEGNLGNYLYALAIGLAVGLFALGLLKFKDNDTLSAITNISGGIKTYFTGVNSYDGLTSELAINAGLVPKKMQSADGKTIYNDWHGTIVLAPGSDGKGEGGTGSDTSVFQIVINDVPKSVCNVLATYQPDMWMDVKVGGDSVFSVNGTPEGIVTNAFGKCTTEKNIVAFITR